MARSQTHCSNAAAQVMHVTSGAPPAVVFTPQSNQVVDGIATAPSRRATSHALAKGPSKLHTLGHEVCVTFLHGRGLARCMCQFPHIIN